MACIVSIMAVLAISTVAVSSLVGEMSYVLAILTFVAILLVSTRLVGASSSIPVKVAIGSGLKRSKI